MSTEKKLSNDASASIRGTLYQICVALERAFMLEADQKLWIEKFGDVTVSGQEQIETKLYSGDLTDSHSNFWNTLKNWLLPEFKHEDFAYLTLLTTQSIGKNSKLHNWNDSNVEQRINILESILRDSEGRHQNSRPTKSKQPSKTLEIQKFVLSNTNRQKLKEILAKVSLAAESPALLQLRQKIIERHGKTILSGKQNAFLDDLIGYMLSPNAIKNSWEITFDEFSTALTNITNRYQRGTIKFPAINADPTPEQIESQSEKLFVQKIRNIEYPEVIADAIRHYLFATTTAIEDFKKYEVDPESYRTYKNNLKQIHQTKHRKATRNVNIDYITASKDFYDDLTGEDPQLFPSFEQTPIDFRNGVYHMLADDEADNFHWRV